MGGGGGAGARRLRARARTYVELSAGDDAGAGRFNTFALADALLRKDKRSLWVLLMQARLAGVGSEELVGTLWWQIKALRMVAQTDTAAQAGLKEYPYKKAKAALSGWNRSEIGRIAHALLELYHRGHSGDDMDIALERLLLSL